MRESGKNMEAITNCRSNPSKPSRFKYLKQNYMLYLMLVPGIAFILIFNYIPMGGIVIAFKDFKFSKGILGSEWIGFENFRILFESRDFYRVLFNSLWLSLLQLVFQFPAPIIVAIFLNEIRHNGFKRVTQTIMYLPHFISWVVLSGIIMNFLSPSDGLVNAVVKMFGGEPIHFLVKPQYFRTIIISAEMWKGLGWGTIIYLAAMTAINPSLYEAATIDGANRFHKMKYITLPGISSTIVILLVLRLGYILSNGFEQIFLLYTPTTYSVADVFETYTYRIGLLNGRFSYATAVGLFKSAVGVVLILTSNRIAKLLGKKALW